MHRLPGLDLVRAVAILWVMMLHARAMDLIPRSNGLAPLGWIGVDLFFALSGFLIGGQLLRPFARGEPPRLGLFYARRLFRTLPPYLVVLALYFCVPAFREKPQIQPFWQFATFTENLFIDIAQPKAFSHVWSLCIEEQFYLVAPLAIWLLMRRPTAGKALAACLTVFIAGLAWREWAWRHDLAPLQYAPGGVEHFWVIWQEKIYYATAARLDDLLGGVMLAMVKAFRPSLWDGLMRRGNGLLILGLAAIGGAAWMSLQPVDAIAEAAEFPILALGATCLVAAGACPRSLIGRWAVPGAGPIAAMAYSLYLTHKAVLHLVKHAIGHGLDGRPVLACIVYGGAVLTAGGLLYLAVERPALRLRDRALQADRLLASPHTSTEKAGSTG